MRCCESSPEKLIAIHGYVENNINLNFYFKELEKVNKLYSKLTK